MPDPPRLDPPVKRNDLLTDGADKLCKEDAGTEVSLQVGDDKTRAELVQIVISPVRVDLSTVTDACLSASHSHSISEYCGKTYYLLSMTFREDRKKLAARGIFPPF